MGGISARSIHPSVAVTRGTLAQPQMDGYYIDVTIVGDGDPVRRRVRVSLAVLRAYEYDARRLYRQMRGRGTCECSKWQRCSGDCHTCPWYSPSDDHDWTPDLLDAIHHARGEYGASAEEVVMRRIIIEQVFALLNDIQREIVLLAADGLNNAEIARALGISRKRVYRTRLRVMDIGRRVIGNN